MGFRNKEDIVEMYLGWTGHDELQAGYDWNVDERLERLGCEGYKYIVSTRDEWIIMAGFHNK